jgi:hypothetical protein
MFDLVIRCWNRLISLVEPLASSLQGFLKAKRGAKNEEDPLTEDEFILRRIHQNNYKLNKTPPVQRVAFEPKDDDHEGLSCNREYFVSAEALAFSGRKPGEYYIARLSVKVLRGPSYQLTIDPTPNPDPAEPRGHCDIRELSISESRKNVNKSKQLQRRLAELASKNIVYIPQGRSL